MIPSRRQAFNSKFRSEKYPELLSLLAERCGVPIGFRVSETPCFLPAELLARMAADGNGFIRQLVYSRAYRARSNESIPAEFWVPNEAPHPMFVQVDFGLVRDADGQLHPKLVELQAFPSLYAYQGPLAQTYIDVYGLKPDSGRLKYLFGELETDSYREFLRRAIVGSHDPENVILMEIDPAQQKTLPDFLLTERMLGVRAVDIVDIKKEGSRLYYSREGKRIPIHRIYNRAIVDE